MKPSIFFKETRGSMELMTGRKNFSEENLLVNPKILRIQLNLRIRYHFRFGKPKPIVHEVVHKRLQTTAFKLQTDRAWQELN